MLNELKNVLAMLPDWLDHPERWESLLINRRKPFTYRVFTSWFDKRVCLHKFDKCHTHEAFPHPHPWPGAFIVLKGAYRMDLSLSKNREDMLPAPVSTIYMTAGSSYEITNPMVWHTVVPLMETYTVMVNGTPWPAEVAHTAVRTTKGKDLDKMPPDDLLKHLKKFRDLLNGNRA